uniref:Uncharacterized protein n=1 Tax=Meloidogyne javanica TaxID=6303 RepID=A0A915LR72_MELJA
METIRDKDGQEILPFFTKRYVFSNHFDCIFVVDGVTFHSSESYYMYYKALFSYNYEIAEQILSLKSAAMVKKLGSNLPGHNTKKWRKICILVMSIANWYKYNQNPELKRILLSTRGILLVEASRSDQYWSCGLEMHSKDIVDKKKWREMSAERLNISSLEEFPPLGSSTKKVILSKPSLPSSSQSDSVVVSAPMVDTLTENTKKMSLEHGEVEESVKPSGESLRGNKNSFEKKVTEYIVVQVAENDVIGARLNQKSNFSWPCFVSIANKIAENSEGFSNKLQLGDRVFISDFQWRVGFEILARNEFELFPLVYKSVRNALPPQSEFKMGSEEMIRDDFGVLGTVRSHLPWRYKREANMPSRLSEVDTKQGQLMKALLAREVEIVELEDVSEPLNPHPLMRLLNERQKETVNSLLSGGCKLVYQQAPPGVGKTFCAAVVTAILLHSLTNAKIAIITSANLPLAKLAKELENVLSPEEMEESKAITFFSGFAKDRYKEMINELRRHMLITKLKLEEISEKFDNNAKQDVKEYCENFESRPRLTSEVKLGSMLSEIVNLKIVFSTAAMAENMVYSSLLDTTVLIVDEATQTSFAEITNLVARLPNLEKILITGDKFQIGTHLQDLPKSLHDGFGLDSIVPQLLISPSVHQTRLSVCYRMHPLLVQCVSYAAYEIHNEPLEPGRSADERALLTNSRFPLPIQSCPIVLINVVGSCRQDVVSHSLTNDLQTTSVVKLVSSLYEYISPEVEFEKLGYNVLTVSVDGYQSMEADLIVLVTTRSHSNDSNLADSSEFFSDENRSTVALSRSKHGLFLVGDIELLKSGRVWSRIDPTTHGEMMDKGRAVVTGIKRNALMTCSTNAALQATNG